VYVITGTSWYHITGKTTAESYRQRGERGAIDAPYRKDKVKCKGELNI